MPKSDTDSQSEVAARVSLAEYDAVWKKVNALQERNAELEDKLKRRRLKQDRKVGSQPMIEPVPTPEPTKEPEKPTPPDKEHTFKPWQAACSTCGEKNPEFKDETKCADCGQKWGSVETARKMDYCPGCAAKTKFAFVTKEARQKFEELAKA